MRKWTRVVATLLWVTLIGAITVSAQNSATPINIGENKTGNVVDPSVPIQYSVGVAAPQSINVQVLAISTGFAPTFTILDPGGVTILDTANPGNLTIVQASPNLSSPGSYTIIVRSANNQPGQFLISVQPGAPLAPPQPLTPGQPLNGSVDAQTSRRAYSFSGLPSDVLLLSVRSTSSTSGPVVALRDADTGETLGLNSARLAGVGYRVGMGQGNYLVEVTHSGGNAPEGFTICLATESGSALCPGGSEQVQVIEPTATPFFLPTATPFELPTATLFFLPTATPFIPVAPTLTPTFAPVAIDPNGSCQVTPLHNNSVNVRSGPGTTFNIVGQISPNTTALVIGRLPDNSWFQVNANGTLGWVSATVVIVGGNCSGVSVVVPPSPIPPVATTEVSPFTATPSATFTATDTPTATPTSNGTPHLHFPPIGIVTLIGPIQIQPITPHLDYQASANYGEANLSAGFSPDPYSVGMTTGGNVNVSYLGSSCSGFATSHPDLRVNFGGGGASLLRIYFVGVNGDASMVVNDPYGNFYCVDNSFGTVNPTLDFNNPAGGSYDIWIASAAANTTISGTVYLTENSGNHP